MSFMYNPFPYNDPRPVNRPALGKETIEGVTCGTLKSASKLASEFAGMLKDGHGVVVALDGYTTADWTRLVNCLSQQLAAKGIEMEAVKFSDIYKSEKEMHEMLDPYLEWDTSKDPTLLYGKVFRGGYPAIFDENKKNGLKASLKEAKAAAGKVTVVYGYGCLDKEFRELYDVKCYLDVTPKESILRIRRGQFANYGDKVANKVNLTIRRCYYADFEMAVGLRGKLSVKACWIGIFRPMILTAFNL